MANNENKKWYLVIAIFTVIITVFGGTLAYWQWTTNTSERTNIALTIKEDFRCDADGGGDISSNEKYLVPTDCMNQDYAIQRTVTVSPTLFTNQMGVDLDLWLTINNIGTGLRNSSNFKYALTKSSTSCTSNVVASGTFKSKSNGSKVALLDKGYNGTVTETYYLYIWLDKAETSTATMDQDFSISLGGECISTTEIKPEAPVLDDGMIPIKLSSTGVATTVSPTDDTWYNYENKEWANMVLVDSESRNTYLNTTGKTVNEDDILAYYVWIPRYKYRIQEKKCSEVENPTEETYPECYKNNISEIDKELLINWWYEYYSNAPRDKDPTIESATEDIETLLEVGYIYVEWEGRDITILEILEWYDVEHDVGLEIVKIFNGNNIVIKREKTIDILFETTTSSISNGNAVETYKTHPSFIWDGETVGGIWVGKFETSHSTLSSSTTSNNLGCTDENCGYADGLIIKPNVKSLRYNSVSNQFYASRSMERSGNPFGLDSSNVDSHMMKNSEWGAVAYLSHSQYGINQEIYINNSSGYYTGRSGGNVGGSQNTLSAQFGSGSTSTKYNTYGYYTWTGQAISSSGTIGAVSNSTLGTKASTTGNITGVYDMSGGAWEYVMGNYNNKTSYSGFTTFPESKYYDLYTITSNSSCTLATCGGQALYETESWYGDIADFASSSYPWFLRGGYFDDGASAGTFSSYFNNGASANADSFRLVLIA